MKRYNSNDHEEVPNRKQKFDEYVVDEDQQNDQQDPYPSKEREYIQRLLKEISELDQVQHSNAVRLLEQEITKVQSSGRIPTRESKYVNVYKEKPIKLTTKVLVPVQDHPKFNFVGKLLGPKGNSLKRLQEETMCKMSILGRGSMRDPVKEQELKNSGDPKFTHLIEDLHVEVTAFGPPAETYARMAFALAEIRKYLIPDKNDSIRQEQLRELESLNGPLPHRDIHREAERMDVPPRGHIPQSAMRSATRAPVNAPRVMPAKTKIMSILDKARVALEESYGHEEPMYRYEGPEYPPSNHRYRRNAMNYPEGANCHWRSSQSCEPRHHSEASRYRSNNYQQPGGIKENY